MALGSRAKIPENQYSRSNVAASVRSGARLVTASQASLQVVRLLVAVVLARLLDPGDFGLVAMAYVVVNFLDIFKDLGTKAAVVQRQTVTREFASSVFVVNVALGAGLTLLIVAVAPLVATVYGEPDVRPVLQVLGVVIGVSSWGLVHQAYLHRRMQFGRLALLHIAIAATNAAVSLTLAFAGWGVWALVLGALSGSVVANVLAWSLSGLRLVPHFSRQDLREIRKFSLNLSGSQMVGFTISNADKFIIGRWLGATALGHYNIAQRILLYPVRAITQMLQEVLFPAMSRIQDDDAALGRGYLRALSGIALLIFPAMTGIAVTASPFVLGVLGSKWEPAIPVIVIIASVGALKSLLHTTSLLYVVKARTDWLLRWTLVAGGLSVASYVVGLPFGIVGVATAYAGVQVLLFYPAFAIPFRLIGLPFSALLRALLPYAISSMVMGAAVLVLRRALELLGVGHLPVLIASVGAGVTVYLVMVIVWRASAVRELILLVKRPRREVTP